MKQTIYRYIYDHGPCTSRQIAKALGISPISRVTAIIRNLSAKGFIGVVGREGEKAGKRMRIWGALRERDARMPIDTPPTSAQIRSQRARDRDQERRTLAQDVEAFLAQGRQIDELPGPQEPVRPWSPARAYASSGGFYSE